MKEGEQMTELLKVAYDTMDQKQSDDLVVIDFRGVSPYVDYFIIGSARNLRLAKAIVEAVEEEAEKHGYEVKHKSANGDSKWQLLDLGDVVCHVFTDGEREVYNLEGLWKDLPTIDM